MRPMSKRMSQKLTTSCSVAAEPLWNKGARAERPRRIGPLNFPMSAHFPVISARPGSVVWMIVPYFIGINVSLGQDPFGTPFSPMNLREFLHALLMAMAFSEHVKTPHVWNARSPAAARRRGAATL